MKGRAMARREIDPAEEAARRRRIPGDDRPAPQPVKRGWFSRVVDAQARGDEVRAARAVDQRPSIETKTLKLDMRTGVIGGTSGSKELEKLLAAGWEVVSERKKSALEWGYMTEYTLRRDNRR